MKSPDIGFLGSSVAYIALQVLQSFQGNEKFV